jgi:hypothetical protein
VVVTATPSLVSSALISPRNHAHNAVVSEGQERVSENLFARIPGRIAEISEKL